MKFIDFYDLEWHDATILKIVVDRSYPESHNQIRLDVQWPDSENTFSSIYFVDFIDFKVDLCGGIICDETIMCASIEEITRKTTDSRFKYEYDEIIRSTGEKITHHSNEKIYKYEIETATTNGLITIVAKGFYLTEKYSEYCGA